MTLSPSQNRLSAEQHTPKAASRTPPTVAARVFLVGCPRSGTTLLQSLLCAHPQVFSVPETHLYSKIPSQSRVLRRLGFARRDAPARFSALLASLGLPRVTVQSPFVRDYLRGLAAALDAATLEAGKTVWLEKTPRHLLFVGSIARALPGAKFVHLVRRGPDVVASLYEVTRDYPEVWGGARSLEACTERWLRDTRLSRRFEGAAGHFTARYEALTADPEGYLRELFAFIGVPSGDAVLAEVLSSYRHAADDVTGGEGWKEGVRGAIRPSRGKFTRLAPERQAYVLGRTRPLERRPNRLSNRPEHRPYRPPP